MSPSPLCACPGRGTACRCLTFSPIVAALRRLEVGERAPQQRQQRDELPPAPARSASRRAPARSHPGAAAPARRRAARPRPRRRLRRRRHRRERQPRQALQFGLVERAEVQQEPAAAAAHQPVDALALDQPTQRALPLAHAARRRRAGPTLSLHMLHAARPSPRPRRRRARRRRPAGRSATRSKSAVIRPAARRSAFAPRTSP